MNAVAKHRRVSVGKVDDKAPASGKTAGRALRPQCPCCAPQPETQRPSQRLAERLAALRARLPPPQD